jgi:flagellar protein FliS
MQTAGYAQYRMVTTQTGGPGDLLLQLYQAAIRNLGQARTAIENGDVADAHHHLVRAQEIIGELKRTLDHERGGEIAERLAALYLYMHQRLIFANVHKDIEPVDEIRGLLRQLLAAWQVAVRETSRKAS